MKSFSHRDQVHWIKKRDTRSSSTSGKKVIAPTFLGTVNAVVLVVTKRETVILVTRFVMCVVYKDT